jgi:murein DD-endopeptidase MepM/ murein hydrolase activator NlpD
VNAPAIAGELGLLLEQLDALVKDREGQLAILDRQLAARDFKSQAFVAGRPIKRGWMSSAFGHRTDPFTGKKAWHNGVDFAGKSGSDVIAIASGVVTAAEKRYGYGWMVEINHGDGFVTRYAHNASNLVAIGDIVEKGGVVARMGSTGRSTGPHVHFEVLRNGKAMNPERYINRASL